MPVDSINPAGDHRVSHCTAELSGITYREKEKMITIDCEADLMLCGRLPSWHSRTGLQGNYILGANVEGIGRSIHG